MRQARIDVRKSPANDAVDVNKAAADIYKERSTEFCAVGKVLAVGGLAWPPPPPPPPLPPPPPPGSGSLWGRGLISTDGSFELFGAGDANRNILLTSRIAKDAKNAHPNRLR